MSQDGVVTMKSLQKKIMDVHKVPYSRSDMRRVQSGMGLTDKTPNPENDTND